MDYKDKIEKSILKDNLLKLNKQQLKQFYSILVHYWVNQNAFISKQNFKNLWCELNCICSEVDDSFPDPYDDYELIKSFCQAHPFYFIDMLEPELVIKLFCYYLDDRLDVLNVAVNKLRIEGLWAAYEHSNKALGLTENIEKLVTQTEEYIKTFS